MKQYRPIFSIVLSRLPRNGGQLAVDFSFVIKKFEAASASVLKLKSEVSRETFQELLIYSDAFISVAMYTVSSIFRDELDRVLVNRKIDSQRLAELRAIAIELKKSEK